MEDTMENRGKVQTIGREIDGEMLAKVLAVAVNCGAINQGRTARDFSEALYNEHRTLQAMVISTLLNILLTYDPGIHVDLRNEAAKKACDQLRKAVDEGTLDAYIPLV